MTRYPTTQLITGYRSDGRWPLWGCLVIFVLINAGVWWLVGVGLAKALIWILGL